VTDAKEPPGTSQDTGFLNVEQCRASLPIKISRREVVRYIRAAGPEFYQEHRRQIFLTPEQWAVVVATIRPPGARHRPPPAEEAYERAKRKLVEALQPRRPTEAGKRRLVLRGVNGTSDSR
jgi:hypothetical protein